MLSLPTLAARLRPLALILLAVTPASAQFGIQAIPTFEGGDGSRGTEPPPAASVDAEPSAASDARLHAEAFRAAQEAPRRAGLLEEVSRLVYRPDEIHDWGTTGHQFSVLGPTIRRNQAAKRLVDEVLRRIFPELERAPFHS